MSAHTSGSARPGLKANQPSRPKRAVGLRRAAVELFSFVKQVPSVLVPLRQAGAQLAPNDAA